MQYHALHPYRCFLPKSFGTSQRTMRLTCASQVKLYFIFFVLFCFKIIHLIITLKTAFLYNICSGKIITWIMSWLKNFNYFFPNMRIFVTLLKPTLQCTVYQDTRTPGHRDTGCRQLNPREWSTVSRHLGNITGD